MGDAYEQKGELPQALLHRQRVDGHRDGNVVTVDQLWRRRLQLSMNRIARGEFVPAMEVARAHARLGDVDATIEWLTRALDELSRLVLELPVDLLLFKRFRGDPRFDSLLSELPNGHVGRTAPVRRRKGSLGTCTSFIHWSAPMSRRWNCGVLVLSFVFFAGCESRPPDPAEYDRAAEQLAATFAATWNAKDGPAYGMAYWPDAELVDPTGLISDGRDAIIKTHEELWAATGNTQASTTVRRVRPVSPTLVVVDITAVVRGFPAPPPGGTADADGAVRSNLKHLAEKRGNEWKILVSQNTFIQPQQ